MFNVCALVAVPSGAIIAVVCPLCENSSTQPAMILFLLSVHGGAGECCLGYSCTSFFGCLLEKSGKNTEMT